MVWLAETFGMKLRTISICIGFLIVMVGCATAPRLNCDQACAMENMVCTGQSMGETTGSSMNIRALSTTRHESSNLTFNCAKDETKAAEIQAIRDSMNKKGLSAAVNDPSLEPWMCVPGRKSTNLDLKKRCELAGL